jgi:hypothetical protein
MKTIYGRIGLLFLVPRDGLSLIVSHCGTQDTGSLPVVTEVGHQGLCTRKVHVVDLVLACYELRDLNSSYYFIDDLLILYAFWQYCRKQR